MAASRRGRSWLTAARATQTSRKDRATDCRRRASRRGAGPRQIAGVRASRRRARSGDPSAPADPPAPGPIGRASASDPSPHRPTDRGGSRSTAPLRASRSRRVRGDRAVARAARTRSAAAPTRGRDPAPGRTAAIPLAVATTANAATQSETRPGHRSGDTTAHRQVLKVVAGSTSVPGDRRHAGTVRPRADRAITPARPTSRASRSVIVLTGRTARTGHIRRLRGIGARSIAHSSRSSGDRARSIGPLARPIAGLDRSIGRADRSTSRASPGRRIGGRLRPHPSACSTRARNLWPGGVRSKRRSLPVDRRSACWWSRSGVRRSSDSSCTRRTSGSRSSRSKAER